MNRTIEPQKKKKGKTVRFAIPDSSRIFSSFEVSAMDGGADGSLTKFTGNRRRNMVGSKDLSGLRQVT